MKFLFSALHFANFRNFESVVRGLAERGHQVHLIADEPETFGGQALVERIAAEHPQVTWGWGPAVGDEPWHPFAQKVRFALDYVRFLDPRYAGVPKLRIRNVERTPRLVRWLTSGPGRLVGGHRHVHRALTALERSMPRSRSMSEFIAACKPDALLLTSLTFSRSFAMDQLKAARQLGIPTAACVMSWDHLSSKALLHIMPNRTLVWNDVQKREAVEMHGLPADGVVVTGAQCYDQWFDRQPSRSREEFCASVGLDPNRPFVLYVCSAMSPVPDPVEPVFVKRWVEALRASGDPGLRDAGVLIRPHPERMREWQGVSLDGLDNVVVHGRAPIDGDAKNDYFDSLFYSHAVVGLCTSVFLEAAIIGRPVLTLLLPEYRIHQEGMAHFRYLTTVEGGLLHTATSLSGHFDQLSHALRAAGGRDERNVRFLTSFIRPRGFEVPATPLFLDAIESLAQGARTQHAPAPLASPFAERVTAWCANAASRGVGAWLMMDALDIERAGSERERQDVKEQIEARRTEYRANKARSGQEQARRKQREQTTKEWRKRLRGFSTRKQIARMKGSLKQLPWARGRTP